MRKYFVLAIPALALMAAPASAFDIDQISKNAEIVEALVNSDTLNVKASGSLDNLAVNAANMLSSNDAILLPGATNTITQNATAKLDTLAEIDLDESIDVAGSVTNTAIGTLNSISITPSAPVLP